MTAPKTAEERLAYLRSKGWLTTPMPSPSADIYDLDAFEEIAKSDDFDQVIAELSDIEDKAAKAEAQLVDGIDVSWLPKK